MRSIRLLLFLYASLLAAAATPTTATHTDPALYLPPETKFLMGIEFRRVMQSPFAASIRMQMMQTIPPHLSPIEAFADIERITIAAAEPPAPATPDTPKPAGRPGEAPFLAVIQGKFDLAKIRSLATADGEIIARYGTIELIAPSDGKTNSAHFALISSSTILAGDAVSVRQAIDRTTGAPVVMVSAPLLRRASALSGANEVWFTGILPPSALPKNQAVSSMFADLRSMEMAMRVTDGIGLQLNLGTKSAESAAKLSYSLASLIQLASMQQAKKADAANLLSQLRIGAEGSLVKISIASDQASLERGLKELAVRQTVKPVAEPPKPPEKRVIRIVGLDGGDREIPFDAPKRP